MFWCEVVIHSFPLPLEFRCMNVPTIFLFYLEPPFYRPWESLWLEIGAILSVGRSAPFPYVLAVPCVAQAGSLRTWLLRFSVRRVLGKILPMGGSAWNMESGNEVKPHYHFDCNAQICGFGQAWHICNNSQVFSFEIIHFTVGRSSDCLKLLAVSVASCFH